MNKQKTGRVEYQLQDKILKAEVDIKKLEELALVYKNEPEKCEGISEKKLNKRINEIGEEVKKFRKLQLEVHTELHPNEPMFDADLEQQQITYNIDDLQQMDKKELLKL